MFIFIFLNQGFQSSRFCWVLGKTPLSFITKELSLMVLPVTKELSLMVLPVTKELSLMVLAGYPIYWKKASVCF